MTYRPPGVMAGLDPAIQTSTLRDWMPGSRPGMTARVTREGAAAMLDDTRRETVSQASNGEPGTKEAEALASALNHSAERVQTPHRSTMRTSMAPPSLGRSSRARRSITRSSRAPRSTARGFKAPSSTTRRSRAPRLQTRNSKAPRSVAPCSRAPLLRARSSRAPHSNTRSFGEPTLERQIGRKRASPVLVTLIVIPGLEPGIQHEKHMFGWPGQARP
jgi:hypothetical protein